MRLLCCLSETDSDSASGEKPMSLTMPLEADVLDLLNYEGFVA